MSHSICPLVVVWLVSPDNFATFLLQTWSDKNQWIIHGSGTHLSLYSFLDPTTDEKFMNLWQISTKDNQKREWRLMCARWWGYCMILHHIWRHSSETSVQYHGLGQVVGMSFKLLMCQSSVYECTNLWGSRNYALRMMH